MNNSSPIAAAWNGLLILVATLSIAYGDGRLAGVILAGLITGAILTALAQRVVDSIVEALPWATAVSGTLFSVVYWLMRIATWLDQAGNSS